MVRVPKSAIQLPTNLPPMPSTSSVTPARVTRKRSQPDSDSASPSTSAAISSSTDSSPRELRAAKRQKHANNSEAKVNKVEVVAKEDDITSDSDAEVAAELKTKSKAASPPLSSFAGSGSQSLAAQRRAYKGKNKATLEPLPSKTTSPASDKNKDDIRNVNKHKKIGEDLAKAKAELSKMKAELQCSICLSTMVDPHAIQCGHTFCRRCLHKSWHREDDPPTPPPETADEDEEEEDEEEEEVEDDDERSSASNSGSESGSGSGSDDEMPAREGAGAWRVTANGRSTGWRAAEGATRQDGNNLAAALFARMRDQANSHNSNSSIIRDPNTNQIIGHAPRPTIEAPAPPARANNNNRNNSRPAAAAATGRAAPPPAARMPPTGAARAAKVVCPSCRHKLTHQAPVKVFVLSTVCESVRAAEQAGGVLASDSEDSKAAQAESDDDAYDANDKTWGGLFHDPSKKLSAKEQRALDAQPMRDADDNVWRCGHCNWEVDMTTYECTVCHFPWDPAFFEENSSSAEDLMNPSGPGGYTFGAGDGDHSESDRSQDEELDSDDVAFLDDGPVEHDSTGDSLESDNESARSTPRKKGKKTSYDQRKQDRRVHANGRKSQEVIDIDSTEDEASATDDSEVSEAGPRKIAKKDRFQEITPDSEEADTSVEVVKPKKKHSKAKANSKKRSSSDLDDDEEVEEVAKPPARRRIARRGAAKVASPEPADKGKGKRRRVIKDSDDE